MKLGESTLYLIKKVTLILKSVLITFIGLVVLLATNCMSANKARNAENDTTLILRTLLNSAFHDNRLSHSGELRHSFPFGDTLIFKSNTILSAYLPRDLRYKLLSPEKICSAIQKYYNKQEGFRYFLELSKFEKKKDSYVASLEVHCLYLNEETGKCESEKYCNGVIFMRFKEDHNKLQVEKTAFIDY